MSSATSTSPGISLLLDDRYRVEEPIARGGMATVYRGHDERLDRVVALKIMHPHLAMDEDFRRRFGREARSAARLAHRNVVGVFDQGADADSIYLAMELIEGPTLRTRIREDGRLRVGETLEITAQVLEALVAAHAAGIVHRDIKPENILLDQDGVVKVADFGLARAIGTTHSSASATLLGTVAYISPEVVTRGHCDERSDLYSLGVVLFEMLTGRQPFTGEAPVHIAFQHVHEDIPAPSSVVTGLPRSLDSLVTWAAARTVDHRPTSAADLLDAVRELLATLPPEVLAARATPPLDAETSDVPRLTSRLDDVVAESAPVPRAFPADLGEEDVPGTAPHEPPGPDKDEVPAAQDESAADGEVPAADRDEGEPSDEDASRRELVLRAPRPRRGRHLPQRLRRRSRVMRSLAALSLVVLLGSAAWSGGSWYLMTGPGADRTIPLLVGSELSEAEAAITGADLHTRTEERFDDSVPAGQVISASPMPGTTVKRGTDVLVVVSRGEQTFAVPELVGEDLESARATLEDLGLVLVEGDPEYSESVPAGEIISQEQAADALPRGGEVEVVASQGRRPITIPDQTGAASGTARSTLEGAGFSVSTSSAHHASVPEGSVISQSPASGTGHRGDPVELVISQGPEMVTVPDVFREPEDDAKATLEAAGFSVTVEHDRGDPVFGLVYEQSAAAGDELAKGSSITIRVF